LINYAKKLKQEFKFDIDFEGEIEEILENPREWAEAQAESALLKNSSRYKRATKLGEDFANGLES